MAQRALEGCARAGRLVICDVVYAELARTSRATGWMPSWKRRASAGSHEPGRPRTRWPDV